ncbi:hypothetical protein JA9_002482 [Meyerozyma sp. JA9]|nr:hypothetical protein JA9_002482 [Meyerozyma sp. JA9]
MTRHPLLVLPQNYIKGPKYLNSSLLSTAYYEPGALASNPFASALVETRLDVASKTRFPKNQTIRLGVTSTAPPVAPDFPSQSRTFQLAPLPMEIDGKHRPMPSSYMVNNSKYINYVVKSGKWRQYIPSKFRFKNDNAIGNRPQISSELSSEVHEVYVEKMKKKLYEQKKSEQNQNEPGMTVEAGTPGMRFEPGTVARIPSACFCDEKSVFVPFSNKALALLILRFIHFQY